MNLAERLQYAMDHALDHPVKAIDLASMIGKSRGAISLILSGDTKSLKSETAMAISSVLAIRTEWLVNGLGTMKDGMKKIKPNSPAMTGQNLENWMETLTPAQRNLFAVTRALVGTLPDSACEAIATIIASSSVGNAVKKSEAKKVKT